VELYGDVVGFLYGWVEAIISSPGSSAAIAIAFATFSTYFISLNEWGIKLLAIAILLLIVTAQIISTRFGVWLQTIATIGKLVPIALIVIFGMIYDSPHSINFSAVGAAEGGGIATALLGVLWAYDGWLNACTLGGEMEKAERNLPRAIVFGIVFVMGVYVLFNIAILNVFSGLEVAASEKIGVDVGTRLFGSGAGTFITIGMMVSVFGALNAQMVCGTRVSLAMGERRQLPGAKALSTINPKLNTPIHSLVFQTIIAIIFILSGTFNQITDLVIFVVWIFFTLGIFGVFILRKKMPHNNKLYSVPLYPIVPILGITGGGYLMYVALKDSFVSAMIGVGLTLAGLVIYYYCKKKYTSDTNLA
jgi:basic amino acid/polyamine antiporter, APA family